MAAGTSRIGARRSRPRPRANEARPCSRTASTRCAGSTPAAQVASSARRLRARRLGDQQVFVRSSGDGVTLQHPPARDGARLARPADRAQPLFHASIRRNRRLRLRPGRPLQRRGPSRSWITRASSTVCLQGTATTQTPGDVETATLDDIFRRTAPRRDRHLRSTPEGSELEVLAARPGRYRPRFYDGRAQLRRHGRSSSASAVAATGRCWRPQRRGRLVRRGTGAAGSPAAGRAARRQPRPSSDLGPTARTTAGGSTSSGTAQIPRRASTGPAVPTRSRRRRARRAPGPAEQHGPQAGAVGRQQPDGGPEGQAEERLRPEALQRLAPRQGPRVAQLRLPADRPPGGHAEHEDRLRHRHDRGEDEREHAARPGSRPRPRAPPP